MKLEEMQALADDWRAADKREHVAYIADDLAAALREVLPVARAAGQWRDDTYPQARSWMATSDTDGDLVSAVDVMRIRTRDL
jgi:hypothetical protein